MNDSPQRSFYNEEEKEVEKHKFYNTGNNALVLFHKKQKLLHFSLKN